MICRQTNMGAKIQSCRQTNMGAPTLFRAESFQLHLRLFSPYHPPPGLRGDFCHHLFIMIVIVCFLPTTYNLVTKVVLSLSSSMCHRLSSLFSPYFPLASHQGGWSFTDPPVLIRLWLVLVRNIFCCHHFVIQIHVIAILVIHVITVVRVVTIVLVIVITIKSLPLLPLSTSLWSLWSSASSIFDQFQKSWCKYFGCNNVKDTHRCISLSFISSIINVIIGILKKICAYEMLIMTRIFGINIIQCIYALVAFELAKIGRRRRRFQSQSI